MWRKFAEEFIGKNQYTAAQAFQVKLVYYKNLVAYEITNHWHKEPPPKEILEEVTAKGGNVMGRTLENFSKPPTRDEKLAEAAEASDTSPGQTTPKEEKPNIMEDPGSATGRSSRGLRQQPPQRVLFQPDTASRQTRGQSSAVNASPTPGATTNGVLNASAMMNGATSTLASYPLTLKPVTTPSNNAEYYRNERKRKAEVNAGPLARKYRNIMLPGTGFIGPNIYVRAQMALQSGIREEEEYALHHLVKISHERGDKYKFTQFPGLADALVRKVLQISNLFYDIDWDINFDDDTFPMDDETLNGLSGTSNIIAKIKARSCHITDDTVVDAQFLSKLNRILEAALAIRNMCMLEENAKYVADMPVIQDVITIVLNLPDRPCTVELRHYSLEIAEQVLRHCDVNTQEDLYQSLIHQLKSSDRGTIITTLRTVARLGMALPPPKRLEDISPTTLRDIQSWLLVEDEELRGACLDFLMQYTSIADNVDNLLQHIDTENLARQLTRLLLFDAKEQKHESKPESKETETTIPPVPRLSRSVVEPLLKLDEPERSSEWLRMCFMPDTKSEMTQISLWQAYQGTFQPFQATHPHLIAGEFIKNVSAVFTGATAQVANGNKYVIRGIRARKVPVETGMGPSSKAMDKGKVLLRCCWKVTVPVEAQVNPTTGAIIPATTREAPCGDWFRTSSDMLKHICTNHLHLPIKKKESPAVETDEMDIDSKPAPNGLSNGINGDSTLADGFDFAIGDQQILRCNWADCKRSSEDFQVAGNGRSTALLARHIQTHLPTPTSDSNHNAKPTEESAQSSTSTRQMLSTLQDETGDAAGLPLGAALVLRNIARFMPKTLSNSTDSVRAAMGGEIEKKSKGLEDAGMISLFFDEEVRRGLFDALSHNKTLKDYVGVILRNVRRSGG
jgi:chromatin structure-remodeling complex subunit RSC9